MYSFKLMSFNIGGYTANCDASRHWDSRKTVCIDIFHRYDVDLIGFQEVYLQNSVTLDAHLTQYESEYGAKTCHLSDATTMYNPIYWKAERFEKLNAGAFYLSEKPDFWSKSWDAMNVRSATWVHLRCLQTGIAFIYVNTHLDHRGEQARIESSKLITRQLMKLRQTENFSAIVSGDFNARAWAPVNENIEEYPLPVLPQHLPAGNTVINIFKEHSFKDAYLEAGYINQLAMNTYHDYYGDVFPPVALRIDWILTLDGKQRIQTREYLLVRDASHPIYASDHYPIIAELIWC